MAFVNVPKDLSTVKTKVALNLTKRQLICFGTAAVIGIPTYIFSRMAIGNSAAALLMIGIMLPLFFIGIYEKDGMPAEVILRNIVRTKFLWADDRPYVTENLYEIMGEGKKNIATEKTKATAKKAVTKRSAGKE